jgi:hypothetical protein
VNTGPLTLRYQYLIKYFTLEINAYSLARAVGIYLDSQRAAVAVEKVLSFGPGGNRIRARTARRWLKNLGLDHGRYSKGVYVDGHERQDVVEYRQQIFLPLWNSLKRRFVIFQEDGSWQVPEGLHQGERPLVFVTHDESTFHANDGKRQGWMPKGEQPIRPKHRGKGIMVSGFLTPGGRLRVPEHISNEELLRDPMWVSVDGDPVREAMSCFEFGKDKWWTSERMVDHTLRIALPIFRYAFPGCQALFAFDNAANHCSFKHDALVAHKMNLSPGGKQPKMRDGWDYNRGLPQTMVFSDTHQELKLRGEPKGIEVVLRERGLWPRNGWRPDGFGKFLLRCPTADEREGCPPDSDGGCCARAMLAAQQDFREQKGQLEEELVAANQLCIFYPKFHCEMNFIERFWCGAKWYSRENCSYSFEALRATVPKALDSVTTASIHRHYKHCERIIEAYSDGMTYGTEEFTKRVYKGHRQVADKSKW